MGVNNREAHKKFVCFSKVVGALAFALGAALSVLPASANEQPSLSASGRFEERASMNLSKEADKTMVLTLDACGGAFDWKLGHWLADRNVRASIFVTKKFIDANPKAVEFMSSRPEIFDIQNHGARHEAAIEQPGELWGVPTVGSRDGLAKEVSEGERAIERAFGKTATVYRGATAVYDAAGAEGARSLGYELGGYSVSLDAGGVLSAKEVMSRGLSAKPGAVLLGHINRGESDNGGKIIAALETMSSRGIEFTSWAQAERGAGMTHWSVSSGAPLAKRVAKASRK